MKILANDGISNGGKEKLEKAGFEVSTKKVPQENLADEINKKSYEVLLVRSATTARKDLIDSCPNLKIIGRGGMGLESIDVEYAESKGIKVINTPEASSRAVAEIVLAHLFGIARYLHNSNRQMPSEGASNFAKLKKSYAGGAELYGKTLGIIGFGNIGNALAKYALGIGMNVLVYDIRSVETDLKVKQITMDELLGKSDFITLHVPKQKDNSAVISEEEFQKMKDGVYVVNTARGGVVDEDALIEALDSGKVAGAALDVFENEPTPREDILNHPKISLSPHIGASTLEAQERIGIDLADQILSYNLTSGS